jgi:hypothetical protein
LLAVPSCLTQQDERGINQRLREGIDRILNGFGKTPLAGKLPSFHWDRNCLLLKAVCL